MSKKIQKASEKKDEQFPLPKYPKGEDIYNKDKEESLEEDEYTGKLAKGKKPEPQNMDLDVPGAEADDADEIIGEEDEENNYYSLGGDNHNDLEEDKGE